MHSVHINRIVPALCVIMLAAAGLRAQSANSQSVQARRSSAADTGAQSAASVDESWAATLDDYRAKTAKEKETLASLREGIATERTTLVEENRKLQDQIDTMEAQLRERETRNANAAAELIHLRRDADKAEQSATYVRSLLRESLLGAQDSMLPGESIVDGEKIKGMINDMGAEHADDTKALHTASGFLLQRLQSRMNGVVLSGQAIDDGSSKIVEGKFVLFGPESYFLPSEGGHGAVARLREGAPLPIVYSLQNWRADEGKKLSDGNIARIPLDSSGGKALQLKRARGTFMDEIRAGGPVGHSIIVLGTFGWMLCIFKLIILRRRRVDNHDCVEPSLQALKEGRYDDVRSLSASLDEMSRGLFATALSHVGKSKEIVEEHLQAYLLRSRLNHERWLPTLRVIATAAPLMGLLGTVTGMVRTFTLITVFGTGNAARLSSGISEALVTTVEGLIVAIPTLVIYSYLAQQTQQALSSLDGYAVEISASMKEETKQ